MMQEFYFAVDGENGPSIFAPPAAWAVARFADELVSKSGPIDAPNTALAVVSDSCSLETVKALSATLKQGRLSPLRFAGSSPSILAGLPAMRLGLRGPSLCLTMPPEDAAQALDALARFWIGGRAASAAILIAHWVWGNGGHLLSGAIVRKGEPVNAETVVRRPTIAVD